MRERRRTPAGDVQAEKQQRYVRLRSGKPYEYVRLLSVPGLKRLMKRETHTPHTPTCGSAETLNRFGVASASGAPGAAMRSISRRWRR